MEQRITQYSLLGQSKQLTDVHEDNAVFLRDPFTASSTDLVVYCLRELTEALHLTVVLYYCRIELLLYSIIVRLKISVES